MSFGREMEDFINAWSAGTKIASENERMATSRYERGVKEGLEDTPGTYGPGTGGGVGEADAPKTGDGGGKTGGKAGPIAWKGASPEQRAFLMTLSGPESAGDYSVIYGGDHFTDFSKHPNKAVPIQSGPNTGDTSSAAGRYQFLGSTWNSIASKYHLTDFSPENQDIGAWYLASETYGRNTGRDLTTDLKSGDPAVIAGIGKALKAVWTSLPGGIEQGTNTDAFVSTYNKFLQGGGETTDPEQLKSGIPPDNEAAPAPAAPAPADDGTAEEDQDDVAPADIDVAPYTAPPEEPVPQVENEFEDPYANPGLYQQGGAIPDDMGGGGDSGFMQFDDGGSINTARDYTQDIAASAPTVTMAPRINANVLAPTATTAKPVVKKPVVKPVVAKPAAPAAPTVGYRMGPMGFTRANRGMGGGNPNWTNSAAGNRFPALMQKWQRLGMDKLSPYEQQSLLRSGYVQKYNIPPKAAAPAAAPGFARGGKVADRDTRFQELLKQESRMGGGRGGGIGGMNESARDRAARRLSREEGRPSSTAYAPSRDKFPPAPARPKTGGGGPRKNVPVPKARPGSPSTFPGRPEVISDNDPGRTGEGGKTWPPGWEKAGEHGRTGPEGWNTEQGKSSPPGWDEKRHVSSPPGWADAAQGGTSQPGNKKPSQDYLGRPNITVPETKKPAADEDHGYVREFLEDQFNFAKGGAIPDDGRETIRERNIRERGGTVHPKRKKKVVGAGAPQTKVAKRKKPKDASKPQKRDQKKTKPRLPKEGPEIADRPSGLPPTGPELGTRPDRTGGAPPSTFPGRPERPGSLPAARPPGPPSTFPGRPEGPPGGGLPAAPKSTFPGRPEVPGGGAPAGLPRPPTPPGRLPPPGGIQEDRLTREFQEPGSRLPFPQRPPPARPEPAQGGVMSPIPGVAAPISSVMDAPRGGTWSPTGNQNSTASPAPPQNGPGVPGLTAPINTGLVAKPPFRPADTQGAQPPPPPNATISPDDTPETLIQKLQAIKASGGMMSPISGVAAPVDPNMDVPRGGTWGPPQYAKGGAIPDDTPNFPEAEEEPRYGASSANEAPVAGQRGYNEAVGRGETANFNEVAQRAAPAVRTGVQGLSRIFGIDPTGQQGVPDEASAARQDDGMRRMASGEGASTEQEVQAIDATTGLDRVQADEGTKNIMRIDKVVNYYLERGDKEKAEAAAASLLQRGAMQVRQAGTAAAAMFEDYQRTGDPNALRHASQMVEKAYSFIPDGADLKIDIDPKTREIVATTIDANGKAQKQVVDPGAIPGLLKQAMDGSAYWSSAFQIGQPRLAEIDRQGGVTGENQRIAREENQAYEQYKFERGEESKIGAEERAAERWGQQQEYLTEQGRSPGERSTREQQQFFESWGQDYDAATDPTEKKALIEEALGFRYDGTRDRQEPVAEDDLRFVAESPYAEAFTDPADTAAVRDIARVIALKEPAMDGTTAMEVTAALVMSPELDFNRDGTINVNGNSIVFNPQLLPQLGALRNKYRQQ